MATAPAYRNHSVQKNDVATAAPSVAMPTGTVDGDILILWLTMDASALNTVTLPSGFTLRRTASTSAPADVQSVHLATKVASSETGPYACTLNGGAVRNTLIVVSYSGADTGVPLTSINSTNTNTGDPTTATATAITTVSTDNRIINFTASDDTGGTTAITQPAGYTERYDSAGGVGDATEFSDIAQAAIGSTGAVTSQIIGGTQVAWLVGMVALAPLSGGGGGGGAGQQNRLLLGVG